MLQLLPYIWGRSVEWTHLYEVVSLKQFHLSFIDSMLNTINYNRECGLILSLNKSRYTFMDKCSNDCRKQLRYCYCYAKWDGLKISRLLSDPWEAIPKLIATCTRHFSAPWASCIWAVFKWLSTANTWLRLLRLTIGLKDSRHFFSQWKAKPKPIAPCTRDFSRASSKIQIIARNCDWFIALSAPGVIGWSNCFGFGFSTVTWKPL